MASEIDVFRVDAVPGREAVNEFEVVSILPGNAGSLMVMEVGQTDHAQHSHPEEHVGVVLEGEMALTSGETETPLKAGDLFRVPPGVPHGIRCRSRAVVVRAHPPAPER